MVILATGKKTDQAKAFFFGLVGWLVFLVVSLDMWDRVSLTNNQTYAPCIGKMESSPLDHQGSPKSLLNREGPLRLGTLKTVDHILIEGMWHLFTH